VLAIGAITFGNEVIVNNRPPSLRIPVATAVAAGLFTLAEKAWEQGAVALAWVALVTILLTRTKPTVPSPVESFLKWWKGN
jgi:hypothetical protein